MLSISTTSWWPLLRDIIPADVLGVFVLLLRRLPDPLGADRPVTHISCK